MPAGGMTVADGCGGSEVMKVTAGGNIQQLDKALKTVHWYGFQHEPYLLKPVKL